LRIRLSAAFIRHGSRLTCLNAASAFRIRGMLQRRGSKWRGTRGLT
jgi:hypothetical protein